MEALNQKRVRLRRELQQAYSAWLLTTELPAGALAPGSPVDTSGCSDMAKARWFEYLAAKERLVLAYAERTLAA